MKNIINPWKKLSSREIYENPWIKVREDQVINPSGGEGIYGVVSMKATALGIIPLDEAGNTWLVGQYRYTLDEYSWEIPMGGGNKSLDTLETAKRELKEETGITANRWTQIMRIHTSNSVTDEEGYVYLAQDLQFGATEYDETEDIKIWKLPFTKVIDMAMDGSITDSISLAGILKMAKLLSI
ncbi:MAG: NUDIX hydrolase [Bacteroidota bacterium]|nr:NUDIX hydrolase [Bacteroidota bacterium]